MRDGPWNAVNPYARSSFSLSCIHSSRIVFAKRIVVCWSDTEHGCITETVCEQLLILGSDKESRAVWNMKKRRLERVMEHTDQEGHQLPTKGPDHVQNAFPLFTDTNDIGSLRWRSVWLEGRRMSQTKKKPQQKKPQQKNPLVWFRKHDTVILAFTHEPNKWID